MVKLTHWGCQKYTSYLKIYNCFRPLDKGLTIDKIKEIRAKLISNRRTRIKPEDEDAGGKGESLASAIGDLEVRNAAFSSKVVIYVQPYIGISIFI